MKKSKNKIKNKILEFLEKNKIKFNLLEHKKVFTAFDEAETLASSPKTRGTQGKKLSEIAKAVLIKVDKSLALVVVPAGKYVDFSGVKKALKAKKVSMAKESDINQKLKTKIGLLHPFGNLYHPSGDHPKGDKITTLLDNTLAKSKKLIAAAASYTQSVELSTKDFEKLVNPL